MSLGHAVPARFRRTRRVGIVVAVLTLLLATPLRAQDVPGDFAITLERTPCGGLCPVYSVTIDARGAVTYRGTMFVRVEGPAADRVSRSQVDALLETVHRIGFFDLGDRYDRLRGSDGHDVVSPDLSGAMVTVTVSGRSKRVEASLGEPEGLRELHRQIDSVARTQRWVRIDVETLRQMVEAGRPPSPGELSRLLGMALDADEIDVIHALIALGVDVNLVPGDEHQGATRPLNLIRSAPAARALIDAGADPWAADEYGQTPMKAAVGLPPEVVALLLKTGVPLEGPVDHVGDTALQRAAALGNIGVVRLLLAAGASPAYRTGQGTALDVARRAQEFERQRNPMLRALRTTPFVQDFDAVVAALDAALPSRHR